MDSFNLAKTAFMIIVFISIKTIILTPPLFIDLSLEGQEIHCLYVCVLGVTICRWILELFQQSIFFKCFPCYLSS